MSCVICHVMSCHIISYRVVLHRITSYHILYDISYDTYITYQILHFTICAVPRHRPSEFNYELNIFLKATLALMKKKEL